HRGSAVVAHAPVLSEPRAAGGEEFLAPAALLEQAGNPERAATPEQASLSGGAKYLGPGSRTGGHGLRVGRAGRPPASGALSALGHPAAAAAGRRNHAAPADPGRPPWLRPSTRHAGRGSPSRAWR